MFSSLLTFSTMALAASSALGATHTVLVGMNTTKTFTPNSIQAAMGDIVNFEFVAGNHTATQSTFADPCTLTEGGFDSGLTPITNNQTKTFSILVNSTTPTWVYCKPHCALGMVMAINAATNGSKTFDAFQAAAKGQSAATNSSATGSSGSSGSTGSSGSGSGADTTGTSSSSTASGSSAAGGASTLVVPAAGGLFAVILSVLALL